MTERATSLEEYLSRIPDDRKEAIQNLRQMVIDHIPAGFEEYFAYGMVGFAVPHSLYPAGYHCDPKLPLPFLGMASQKGHISFYHMGLYADANLMDWFTSEFAKRSKHKLDMGKSCIRFKKVEHIEYRLLAELCQKMTPAQWIALYEKAFRKGG